MPGVSAEVLRLPTVDVGVAVAVVGMGVVWVSPSAHYTPIIVPAYILLHESKHKSQILNFSLVTYGADSAHWTAEACSWDRVAAASPHCCSPGRAP